MKSEFKSLKPSNDELKVFNPATGLHLKPEGEEVAMSNYWHRRLLSKEVVECEQFVEKKSFKDSKKNNSEV